MSASHMKPQRINPRRPQRVLRGGLKRLVLTAAPVAEKEPQNLPLSVPAPNSPHVLVIVSTENGALSSHAQQVIAAASILAKQQAVVNVLILGALKDDLSTCGADVAIVMPELDVRDYQPALALDCANALINALRPQRIYLPDAAEDGDLGRRLIASQPNLSAATHVVEIDHAHVYCYQQQRTQLAKCAMPQLLLLAAGAVEATLPYVTAAAPASAALQQTVQAVINTHVSSGGVQDKGVSVIPAADLPLEEADFIVSAGNGVANIDTFTQLANRLGAAIGASRVAVDNGSFSRDKQIGATGKTVSATTYLAIGISGAVQHLQGIKDCRHVIAINRDASAPMIKRANLSLIGDADSLMRALMGSLPAHSEDGANEH